MYISSSFNFEFDTMVPITAGTTTTAKVEQKELEFDSWM